MLFKGVNGSHGVFYKLKLNGYPITIRKKKNNEYC